VTPISGQHTAMSRSTASSHGRVSASTCSLNDGTLEAFGRCGRWLVCSPKGAGNRAASYAACRQAMGTDLGTAGPIA
jgi:hypothetical protein